MEISYRGNRISVTNEATIKSIVRILYGETTREQVAVKQTGSSYVPKKRRNLWHRWSPTEVKALVDARQNKTPMSTIARRLGRNEGALYSMLDRIKRGVYKVEEAYVGHAISTDNPPVVSVTHN